MVTGETPGVVALPAQVLEVREMSLETMSPKASIIQCTRSLQFLGNSNGRLSGGRVEKQSDFASGGGSGLVVYSVRLIRDLTGVCK